MDYQQYLEKTIEITRALTLDQIQKQWDKIQTYEYRMKKLQQLINTGFVTVFIVGVPLYAYNEIKKNYSYHELKIREQQNLLGEKSTSYNINDLSNNFTR